MLRARGARSLCRHAIFLLIKVIPVRTPTTFGRHPQVVSLVASRSDSYLSTRGLVQQAFSRSFVLLMTESPHSTRIGLGSSSPPPGAATPGLFRSYDGTRRTLSRAGAQPFCPRLTCTRSSKPPADAFFALTRDSVGSAAPARDQSDWGSHGPGPPGIPTLHRDVNLAGTCTIVQHSGARAFGG